ncbi:MAG TPA: TadE/TadG family type IV pilus assembly protein [Vicinamibacterales bacterium]|nr:TadE/TadG family type IV pilus assembly protein [Vicinamibacterales bacterium]
MFRIRRLIREERATAILEFTLVAIVFFMITMGIMEYARMILAYDVVANATRDGVRYAAVRGAQSAHIASASDIKTYVASHSMGHLSVSNVTVTWTPNNSTGSTVQVQSQYNFQSIVPLLPQDVVTLSSTAKMVITY